MRNTWWEAGDWNAICDVCGFKFKASQLRLRWDGLRVCDVDWETRHPQELIRPIPDEPALPWTRPEGCGDDADAFVLPDNGCAVISTQGISNYAIADCAIADRDLGLRDTLAEVETFR